MPKPRSWVASVLALGALACGESARPPQDPPTGTAGMAGSGGSTISEPPAASGMGGSAQPLGGSATGGVAVGGGGSGSGGLEPAVGGEGGAADESDVLLEWPDATNTGVAAGTVLSPSGSLTITTDGQIIEGLDIQGSVVVKANDVTIRNSKITNDATAIRFEEGEGLRVERVTFVGTSAKTLDGAIQAWGTISVRRIQVTGFGEGVDIYGTGGLIQDSYFHDMGNADGKLMDGIEAWEAKQLVIRHNWIEMPGGNSVIKLPLDVPVPGGDDVLIENNLIAGGGWAVYGGYDPPNSNPSYTNVRFIANHFSTMFEPKCGFYGAGAFIESALSRDNVWHETGEPLEL